MYCDYGCGCLCVPAGVRRVHAAPANPPISHRRKVPSHSYRSSGRSGGSGSGMVEVGVAEVVVEVHM